jgi:hypothetical protein
MPPRYLFVVDDDVGIRAPDDELSIALDDLTVGGTGGDSQARHRKQVRA